MEKQNFWNAAQQSVLDACVPGARLSVLGAPGSGKTALLQACVESVHAQWPQARIAVLTPDRKMAGYMRNVLSNALGGLNERIDVRSITALSYSIVTAAAQKAGRRSPELISGPDQDAVLKDIFDLVLQGALPEVGEAALADADISLHTAQLPAFRSEIRDLLTRAAELGLNVSDLHKLGNMHNQPLWVYGAQVMKLYEASLASQAAANSANPDRVDHARIVAMAAAALACWDKDTSDSSVGGAMNTPCPHWDFVFIDDIHNATLAVRGLLQEIVYRGGSVVTFGNPDQAVEGYRGGIAQLPIILTYPQPEGIGAEKIELNTVYRGVGQLAQVMDRITSGIPVLLNGGIRHPEYCAKLDDYAGEESDAAAYERNSYGQGEVLLRSFPNDSEETAYVAQYLRNLHILKGVPYSRMAIITRSGSQHEAIRHILSRYRVPVTKRVRQGALRDQPAVAALLSIVALALEDKQVINKTELRGKVESVLTSRLVNIDPLHLRHMARRIQATALLDGVAWNEKQVWEEFAYDPTNTFFAGEPLLQPLIAAMSAVQAAHKKHDSAGRVLWSAWNSLDVAEQWRDVALGESTQADQANTDLDSIIQLFRAAQRLEDRDASSARFDRFAEILQAQDLPEDSIAVSGQSKDSVTLTTPSGSVGQVWDYVVIMGLNDGVWPNTRLRNPVTHVPELVNVVVESILAARNMPSEQRRADVMKDEMRLLLQSASRAKKMLLISCIQAEDKAPSMFADWISADKNNSLEIKNVKETVRVIGKSALIGELRLASKSSDAELSLWASELLNELARAGINEADICTWADTLCITGSELNNRPAHYLGEECDIERVSAEDQNKKMTPKALSVSPSRVESMLACPLKGFLDMHGGQDTADRRAADLGTLIHAICQKYPKGPYEKMEAELEAQWASVGYDPETFADMKARRSAYTMLAYMADRAADPKTPQGVVVEKPARYRFRYHGDSVSVNARLDRLEFDLENPAHVYIVDIKTGSNSLSRSQVSIHPQLLIYQWLVNKGALKLGEDTDCIAADCVGDEELLRKGVAHGEKLESEGAKLLFVKYDRHRSKAEAEQGKAGEEQMQLAERMICAAADVLSRSEYVAVPSNNCRNCSYTWLCPAGEGERIFS